MYQLATCTVSILRGTTTNAYGDVVDASTVLATGIPAALTESSTSGFDPATQTARTVHDVSCSVPSTTDVTEGDRLRDDTHSVTYFIEAVTRQSMAGMTADYQLQLRRVT